MMSGFGSRLKAHARLAGATLIGIAAGMVVPGVHRIVTRGLIGWDVAVWSYLLLAGWTMFRADHHRVRRVAEAQSESAPTVLAIVVLASIVSLLGIVFELQAAKAAGTSHAALHVVLAIATVVGSWLLLPTLFALTYASVYYREEDGAGLNFPEADERFQPDHADFLYVAFTIAVASQTSDVAVTTRPMRRLVLAQSVLSFAFNTAILAFTINIAASMF